MDKNEYRVHMYRSFYKFRTQMILELKKLGFGDDGEIGAPIGSNGQDTGYASSWKATMILAA